ncbi:MAG: UDP-4-amino-4,6-dideoxy-N-acetyl-beta-L-altrosamine transaminase [Deltaproteobacteria bacterium CG11_big_fil_rev_8_21_14_0_20_45_16]|nr:MAG: UDP-4-amino-4,6-dideoxy-N-acetyl-beta-L-altrosamine transaminase [Deltaproteobacteria bacterium CG11_big_fil_rev_8_21_14_0_20_45_16]
MSASATSKLALEGGDPVRSTILPYGRQTIDADDQAAVLEVLRSSYITRGPRVQAFEQALADYCGVPYAVAFTSATAGLHASMVLVGIKALKRVLVPAITFTATANAVRYVEGEVVFGDLRSDTLNLNEKLLDTYGHLDAIVCVDYAGQACAYDEFKSYCQSKKIPLIADAAHSLGGSYKNKKVGSLADINVLSFHPVKSITSGEGGAVLVWNERDAKFLRQFRNHGNTPEIRPGYYEQEFLGFNYHFTEMQAALGGSQLKKLDSFVARREEIAKSYNERLSRFDWLERPKVLAENKSAYHLYPIRLNLNRLSVDRDKFLEALRAENVYAQVHYIPVYWQPYYQQLGYSRGLCPVAEAEYASELSLPIFPSMNEMDIEDVVRALDKLGSHFLKK